MEITKEFLEEQHRSCVQNRERAKADVLLYDGAAQAIEKMIAHLDKEDDALTLEEFRDAIGADSVEIG